MWFKLKIPPSTLLPPAVFSNKQILFALAWFRIAHKCTKMCFQTDRLLLCFHIRMSTGIGTHSGSKCWAETLLSNLTQHKLINGDDKDTLFVMWPLYLFVFLVTQLSKCFCVVKLLDWTCYSQLLIIFLFLILQSAYINQMLRQSGWV